MKKKTNKPLHLGKLTLLTLAPGTTKKVKGGSHWDCGSVSNWLLCPPATEFTCVGC